MANTPGDEWVREFWKKVGEKRGGDVGLNSFGCYLGRSGDGAAMNLTGLIYLAAGALWFETVDSPKTFMGFFMGDNGKKQAYEPYETRIDLADIEGAARIGLKDALACIDGKAESPRIRPLSFFGNFFDRPVVQIRLRDGTSAFFEAARDRELIALLNGGLDRP